jgi:hypothetical protein
MLRVGRAPTVAAPQNLTPIQDRTAHLRRDPFQHWLLTAQGFHNSQVLDD